MDEAPGVYAFRVELAEKSKYNARSVSLCSDGVFWSVCWEVVFDRASRVVKRGAGQWIQPVGSVRLVSRWVRADTRDSMEESMTSRARFGAFGAMRRIMLQRRVEFMCLEEMIGGEGCHVGEDQ